MTEKGIVVEVIRKTTAWASWGVPRFRERKQPTLTEVSWTSAWQWERPAAFPATLVEVRRRERGQTKKRCRLRREDGLRESSTRRASFGDRDPRRI